jgi:diadenosine tetraphosphate (Ap4A) HIT family hydrolase
VSDGLAQLWAGWRHSYVAEATEAERSGEGDGCVFCRLAASGPPSADNGVVWRGPSCYCVLNAYPYASGHLLVLPLRHVERLDELTVPESAELWRGVNDAVAALEAAYRPDGLNVGANLGRAAGAGIPTHLHLHVVPRWSGDTNFMTSLGGVRVLPQSLGDSWALLAPAWPLRSEG